MKQESIDKSVKPSCKKNYTWNSLAFSTSKWLPM